MKKNLFNKAIWFLIILAIANLILFLFFYKCSESKNYYEIFCVIFSCFNVIVLSITLLRITETNNIQDRINLNIEKKDFFINIRDLRDKLDSKKEIKIVDESNIVELANFYSDWLDSFNILIDYVSSIQLKDIKTIKENMTDLFYYYKTNFYDKIPAVLLLKNNNLSKRNTDIEKKLKN